MTPELQTRIQELIQADPVVLFMKGERAGPRCGFSATVVELLDQYLPDYTTVDVLADPDIRDGIKEFSEWPTIPQLYVRGEFLGGCDIVREMDEQGELLTALGEAARLPEPPNLTISDSAAAELRKALDGGDDELILKIDGRFQNELNLGPAPRNALRAESNGVAVFLDAATARRAEGLSIDYVETPEPGFKIDNPNAPAQVLQMTAAELKAKLDAGEALTLIDVRTPKEIETARIEGARAFSPAIMQELMALPKDTPLVFHCHHGGRSQQAAEHFIVRGFTNVSNLVGGIDRWSIEIDPNVPRY